MTEGRAIELGLERYSISIGRHHMDNLWALLFAHWLVTSLNLSLRKLLSLLCYSLLELSFSSTFTAQYSSRTRKGSLCNYCEL